ncbi:flagellar assembly peptidoglycan hydrolase FlgJ [Limnohabitans sp. T6-20]|nr:flagellar assembly peptidoglycan hydrolase FlgJ [Limnohabitans sp. T6-20]
MAMAEALQPDTPVERVSTATVNPMLVASRSTGASDGLSSTGPRGFLAQHAQAARQAQASSGIPATFMVAQAALETGWGRQEIRFADGRTSHNLFGIKAGANWKGPVAEIWTTEFVNGSAQKVRGQFRAYGSYEESFNDYARMISQNPRYANAMRNLGDPQAFASSLQQAGYATAPNYANLLTSVIQTAQRLQDSMPNVAAAVPTTAQMLSLRGGGASATPLSALNTLPASTGAPVSGSRQWRQSPYAHLDVAKTLP